jgi:aspartokinase/homoserine dehydrogenase 1
MRVVKFGGSSVGTPSMIERILSICNDTERPRPNVVVVSAFQGITNSLLELAEKAQLQDEGAQGYVVEAISNIRNRHFEAFNLLTAVASKKANSELSMLVDSARDRLEQWFVELEGLLKGIYLLQECSARTSDHIASFGECFSALIVAMAFNCHGVRAEFANAIDFIKVNGPFGNVHVDFDKTSELVKAKFNNPDIIYVVTGFIGSNNQGVVHTLGRGGSDYTASILASVLGASVLEIWTDVDGIMTCDPRKVKSASSVSELSYSEALELCHFGAKVVYPPTLQPAMASKVPIRILNTFAPNHPGSLITENPAPTNRPITGISSINDISLILLQGSGIMGVAGSAMRLFRTLASVQVNVILITQASSEHSICVGLRSNEVVRSLEAINEEFRSELSTGQIDPISVEGNLSVVTVVGDQLRNRVGIAGTIFGTLGRNGINICAIAQGSSERSISVVVRQQDEDKALNTIHDEFFENVNKQAHLVVVGTGSIGKTFLRQVADHRALISSEHQTDLKIVGLAKSNSCIFNLEGFSDDYIKDPNLIFESKDLHNFSSLELITGENIVNDLVEGIKKLGLSNVVVVDCTASDAIPAVYLDLLRASFPIVTPNKKFQSGDYVRYKEYKELSRYSNIQFLYETSVGAGLPIIGTLKDLLRSGDRIIKIEAILSGTLSYIFNSWDGTETFSQLVRRAQNLGFTEPDPRDDLSGKDVGRKILILARECGAQVDLHDVDISDLTPEACREAKSVDQFYKELADFDDEFESKRARAESEGKKLCYVATFEMLSERSCEKNKSALRGCPLSVRTELLSVDSSHPFYNLSANDNIVSFTTERYNNRPLVVQGPGAGAEVTAAGVLADVLRLVMK